jgi:hypothetical protein
MEKYYTAAQATDDNNAAHAHCMLDTQSYKYTLTICNNYCFSIATLVARTRFNFTLYLHTSSALCSNMVIFSVFGPTPHLSRDSVFLITSLQGQEYAQIS